jgi:hypothetical protein
MGAPCKGMPLHQDTLRTRWVMREMPNTHVAQLVRQSLNGDQRAFGGLVQRFQNAGFAVAVSHVGNPHDAEDVLQDAFVTAYCKLGQLRDPSLFPGWFRSVVVTQCRMWLRQSRLQERVTEVAEVSGKWILNSKTRKMPTPKFLNFNFRNLHEYLLVQ